MNTRRVVLVAVLAFVLAWGTLVSLAVQRSRHPVAPREARLLRGAGWSGAPSRCHANR